MLGPRHTAGTEDTPVLRHAQWVPALVLRQQRTTGVGEWVRELPTIP